MFGAPVATGACKWMADGAYACGGSSISSGRESFAQENDKPKPNESIAVGRIPMFTGKNPAGSAAIIPRAII